MIDCILRDKTRLVFKSYLTSNHTTEWCITLKTDKSVSGEVYGWYKCFTYKPNTDEVLYCIELGYRELEEMFKAKYI